MIGIDISDRSVKIARLNRRGKFLSADWSAIPANVINNGVIADPAVVSQIIKVLLHQWHGLKYEPTVASVSSTDSFLRVVDVPVMPANEVGEAAMWEAARHLPFDVDSIYADWQPVEEVTEAKPDSMELLVGAAEKKKIDVLWNALSVLDLDVVALELESVALVRSLIRRGMKETRGLLIVDVGGTNTNVIVYDCGTIRFTANLTHGISNLVPQDPGQDPAATQNGATPGAVQNALNTLASGVHSIVEYYNNLFPNHSITEILLTGGGSLLGGLDKAFLGNFDNIHIQRGDPWVNIVSSKKLATPPLPPVESAHYATALGLALRNIRL